MRAKLAAPASEKQAIIRQNQTHSPAITLATVDEHSP
jgi:hypothetical protein